MLDTAKLNSHGTTRPDWKWSAFTPSNRFNDIITIIGLANRRDALHIDSAHKSGCRFFFTTDRRDVLAHRDELFKLLDIRFFHPGEQDDAEQLILECGH